MRTKSPAVVQRWVDSLPNDSVTDPVIAATSVNTDNLHLNETIIEEVTKDQNDEEKENSVHASTIQVDDIEKSSPAKHHLESDTNNHSAKINLPQAESFSQAKNSIVDNCSGSYQEHQRFWHRGSSIISSLRKRGNSLQLTETDDLNSSVDLSNDETNPHSTASTNINATTTSQTSTILNKSKLNELYDKLNISRKRYNFITERKMEAKKIINNAKSRFLGTSSDQQHQQNVDNNSIDNNVHDNDKSDNNNLIVSADAMAEASASTSNVCDNIEMDISTDDFSRLSQSNDLLSADDEDSFNISMPSINDGPAQHLSVNRKMIMADIGRSTSDNPRIRNKFYLADIGRSFSEHQDDDAIIISERNISAPTSSIAIQNNNKSNGNFYERRAYSVSPTQRNLKRDVLSRDHSLSDSSRHRHQLSKGSSFQSDSSHCSSVESLLDARKPDPEAILRHLGFGPAHQEDLLSRIPKRYVNLFINQCDLWFLFRFFFFF